MLQRIIHVFLILTTVLTLIGCNDSKPMNEFESLAGTVTEEELGRDDNPQVEVVTNHGTFVIELYADVAPATVTNFLQYAEEGYYNDTIIHRVIKDFIIEAGGYTDDLERRQPKPPIKNEAQPGAHHLRGTVAMARHAHPDTANSKFFINLTDNPVFDIRNGYTVFGRVIAGMDVVDAIGDTKTGAKGQFSHHVPIETVYIKKVTILIANKPTSSQQRTTKNPNYNNQPTSWSKQDMWSEPNNALHYPQI